MQKAFSSLLYSLASYDELEGQQGWVALRCGRVKLPSCLYSCL